MLKSGTTSYYEADGLGTVTSLSNSSGALAKTYSYDSFGKLVGSSGTISSPYGFTGRELDSETGLTEYRARYYDPQIGRFMSEDPIRFGGGMNFYRYVGNSPLNYVDPFGLTIRPQISDLRLSPSHPRSELGRERAEIAGSKTERLEPFKRKRDVCPLSGNDGFRLTDA